MKNLQLSIIIPVYNESENILKTLNEIKKHIHIPHEILIIYDFDGDTTLPVLKHVLKSKKNLFVMKNIVTPGPSGAIRTGIKRAKAPRVLVTMGDLCDDLSQVKDMLKIVPEFAAIACPSRYMPGGKQQINFTLKVLAPRIAGFLLKNFAGINTYDPTNSYKMYSKEMLEKLELKSKTSFSVTLEIVVKSKALGYKLIEIPTVWHQRVHGKSKFKFGKSLVVYMPWFLFAFFRHKI